MVLILQILKKVLFISFSLPSYFFILLIHFIAIHLLWNDEIHKAQKILSMLPYNELNQNEQVFVEFVLSS